MTTRFKRTASRLALSVVVALGGLSFADSTDVSAGQAGFVPVMPARLLETRSGASDRTVDAQYQGLGIRPAGSILELQVAGRGGVPGGADAVMLNITAVEARESGFLTVFPCGSPQPLASNLNFAAGQTVPNAVFAAIGAGGNVCIYTSATTHIVVDSNGYGPTGGSLAALLPARLLETRSGPNDHTIDGAFQGVGPQVAGSTVVLQVAGRGGVPAGADSAMLNVTAIYPMSPGFFTVYPCDSRRPLASSVNFVAGQVVPNAVFTALDTDGRVCVYTSASTHMIVDANGFGPTGGPLASFGPSRLLETRNGPSDRTVDRLFEGVGPIVAGATVELPVAGRGNIPAGATSAMLNVTAVYPMTPGYLTVFPCGQPRPLASNLNFVAGQVVPNSVFTGIGVDGKVCIFTSASVHIVVDTNGYGPNTPGSLPVGVATYAAPSGALFVANSGNDDASGTRSNPLRTVGRAISRAQNGGTIVVRGGTYNEAVTIPSNKTLTIQGYPGEAVWFDGSRSVGGWSQSGSTWVKTGWTTEFSSNASYSKNQHLQSWIDPAYPMASHPDQVYIDGKALKQVASAGQVVAGTFAVDYGSDRLIIGDNPNGHDVRASTLQQAFLVLSDRSVLQGFGVRRYAPSVATFGALWLAGDHVIARNLVITDNATLGMSVVGDHVLLDRLTVTKSGLLGIHGNNADGIRVTNSAINNNNSENFKMAPTSAGLKITRTRGVTLANNEARNNNGMGLWLDETVVGFSVINNVSVDNGKAGILTELSDTGIIAGNTTTGGEIGIWVYNTGNVKIYNNLVAGARTQDMILKQDERRQGDTQFTGQDRRFPIPDPAVPWLLRNITVSNNIFASGGPRSLWVQDISGKIAPDDMNIKIVGNYFTKRGSGEAMLRWGKRGSATALENFTSVAQMQAYNPSWVNIEAGGSFNVDQMLATAESVRGAATAIPADIAGSLGLAIGELHLGNALG